MICSAAFAVKASAWHEKIHRNFIATLNRLLHPVQLAAARA
jgi:hypothetical protein